VEQLGDFARVEHVLARQVHAARMSVGLREGRGGSHMRIDPESAKTSNEARFRDRGSPVSSAPWWCAPTRTCRRAPCPRGRRKRPSSRFVGGGFRFPTRFLRISGVLRGRSKSVVRGALGRLPQTRPRRSAVLCPSPRARASRAGRWRVQLARRERDDATEDEPWSAPVRAGQRNGYRRDRVGLRSMLAANGSLRVTAVLALFAKYSSGGD